MELPYIIGFGVFVVVIVGVIIWLIKDYYNEKELQDKINKNKK